MKRFLALLALLGVLAVAAPVPAPAVAPAVAAYEPHPTTINGYRFWTGSICVDGSGVNGPYYRVGYIAQQWNLRVGNTAVLALDYEDDCAAAGYTPSRTLIIGGFNNPDHEACSYETSNQASLYNGMYRWTGQPGDGLGVYINFAIPSCISSQTRRDHLVSELIGSALGLKILNSSGYNSRVMNNTAYSWDNVPLPDAASGSLLWSIYTGYYGG